MIPLEVNPMLLNFNTPRTLAIALTSSLALLTVLASYSCYQWTSDYHLSHESLPPTPNLNQQHASTDYATALPNYHLFGKALPNLGKVPLSNLQVRVVGIVKLEGSNEASKAYISMSGQNSKIYQVGDMLTDGVKVYDITPYAVILENDGHLEKLPLVRHKLHFKNRVT